MSKPLVLDGTGKTGEIPANEPLQFGNAALSASGLTAPRTYTFPDKSGPVALVLDDVIVTTNTTVENGKRYWVNTAGGAITLTIPASVAAGFTFAVGDYSRTFATNNCTIARNGHKIENLTDNFIMNYTGLLICLRYIDATVGFKNIGNT